MTRTLLSSQLIKLQEMYDELDSRCEALERKIFQLEFILDEYGSYLPPHAQELLQEVNKND